MITEFSRGRICFDLNGTSYRAEGEMLLPADGSIEFVLYTGTIKTEKGISAVLPTAEIQEIVSYLQEEFGIKNRVLIVEP